MERHTHFTPRVLMCSLIVAEPFACGVLCKAGGLACGCRGGEVVGSWAMSWPKQLGGGIEEQRRALLRACMKIRLSG